MEFASSLSIFSSDKPIFIEKRIRLLELIVSEGSISAAAKKLPMSYKAAWDTIDSMNNISSQKVVEKETGGKGGGGAVVTEFGLNLITSYNLLKEQHLQFISKLNTLTDFDTGKLKSLERIAMQTSARNQIVGKIEEIKLGEVNAIITLIPNSGQAMVANISKESVENLNLKKSDEIIAIIKASNVMLSKDKDIAISARNKITGRIKKITQGNVNCDISIDIGNGTTLSSVITADSCKTLNLKIDDEITVIIKSSDIIIGK